MRAFILITKLYVSQDGCCTRFDIYYFTLYLFKVVNYSFFKLMIHIESSILLKNHVSCNFILKYYIKISVRQFMKNLNQFFQLSRVSENLEICVPVWFVQFNEPKQFWGNLLDDALINGHYLKKYKIKFSLKTHMIVVYNLNVTCNETTTWNTLCWITTRPQFFLHLT